jgi:hypothetical protein
VVVVLEQMALAQMVVIQFSAQSLQLVVDALEVGIQKMVWVVVRVVEQQAAKQQKQIQVELEPPIKVVQAEMVIRQLQRHRFMQAAAVAHKILVLMQPQVQVVVAVQASHL